MRKMLVVLTLALLSPLGCAWSHYQTAYDDGTSMKCWSIVVGKGKIGADCRKVTAKLASEDTGLSDNFVKLVGASTEGAVRGLIASQGLSPIVTPAEPGKK